MPEAKYYDPVKAHEYYENYTKKGLLKGRGNGTTKNETKTTMSTRGWNETQRTQFKSSKSSLQQTKSDELKRISENASSRINAVSDQTTSQLNSLSRALKTKMRDISNQKRANLLKESTDARVKTSHLNRQARDEIARRNDAVQSQIDSMRHQMESEIQQLKGLPYSERRQKVDHYVAAINRIRVRLGLDNTKTVETTAKQVNEIQRTSSEKQVHINDKYAQKADKEKKNAETRKTKIRKEAVDRKNQIRSEANQQKQNVRAKYQSQVKGAYSRINSSRNK